MQYISLIGSEAAFSVLFTAENNIALHCILFGWQRRRENYWQYITDEKVCRVKKEAKAEHSQYWLTPLSVN
jgi:hypothetical protein